MQRSVVQRYSAFLGNATPGAPTDTNSSYRRSSQSQFSHQDSKEAQQQQQQQHPAHPRAQQPSSNGGDSRPSSHAQVSSREEDGRVWRGGGTEGADGVVSAAQTTGPEGQGGGGAPFAVTFDPAARDVLLGRDSNNTLASGVAGLISIASDDASTGSRAVTGSRGAKQNGNAESGDRSCDVIDVGGGQSITVNSGGTSVQGHEPTLKRHRPNDVDISVHLSNVTAEVAAAAASAVAAAAEATAPVVPPWRWQVASGSAGATSGSGGGSLGGDSGREPISLGPANASVSSVVAPEGIIVPGSTLLREHRGRPPGSRRSRPAVACVEPGCKRPPTYGTPGDDRAAYCAGHGKLLGLQNIVTPRCRHRFVGNQRCPLWPAFGRETDKSPTYCAQHALQGMKNINNPKCKSVGCERWPSFGILGTKTALYCGGHKMEGMVDVVKPRCREGGCLHRPSFGWRFEKVPSYCRAHKADGMIDVANPRCTFPECIRRPSFGVDGQRASRCSAHRLEGMVDVVKPRCRVQDCQRIAYYKEKGTKGATRCSQHQEEGMVRKN